jgi:hypothetical protein
LSEKWEKIRYRIPEGIGGLPLPSLATLIENLPGSPEIRERVLQGKKELPSDLDFSQYGLGLCCTHFGYIAPVWQELFAPDALLNPNEEILQGISFPPGNRGIKVDFYSKIPLSDTKIAGMKTLFASAPPVAEALENYHFTPDLYQVR